MAAVARMPPGYRVMHFEDIDSTNAEAQRLALSGELGPLWIWADKQQQGRGRQGRSWISEAGNLYASLLISTAVGPQEASGLSLVAALAVHGVIQALLPDPSVLELKWPNDVLLAHHKVAGILIESLSGGLGMIFVIGCGINLTEAPGETRYGATALSRYGVELSSDGALEMLASFMDRWLKLWDAGRGFEAIRTHWLRYGKGVGGQVQIALGSELLEGRFEGLGDGGALLLRLPNGHLRSVLSGEVQYMDYSEARGQ